MKGQNGEASAQGAVVLYDSYGGNEGHRADYYAVFGKLIGTRRTSSLARAMFTRKPVLVGALEASLPRYVLLCLWRSIFGRHTAGLMFRPLPVIAGGTFRMRIKRGALSLLRRLPRVATLTLLPFSLDPRFSTIARSWIYDPQLWDLHYPGVYAETADSASFAAEIRQKASGRRICCAIGRQDESKGFTKFAELYAAREDLRGAVLFAAGGEVPARLAGQMQALTQAGGVVHSRVITNAELLAMYACADLIWCCYDPDYDQASGVFGRALQLGVPAIVREGSLLHRYCLSQGLVHIAYNGRPETFDGAARPSPAPLSAAAQRAKSQGEESVRRLRVALGLEQPASETGG